MIVEIRVPSPGESITEVEIASWLVSEGEYIDKDAELCEIDSDKATLTINAEESGSLSIKIEEGETVAVGDIICTIDTSAEGKSKKGVTKEDRPEPVAEVKKQEVVKADADKEDKNYASGHPSAAANKLIAEAGVGLDQIKGSGKNGRITKQDVISQLAGGVSASSAGGWGGSRDATRRKMSMLRRKLASRLVAVKNETAMLTTFNEVDMKPVMDLRTKYKAKFEEVHGVKLGFMSFFTKAVTEALSLFPNVNAILDGEEIITHNYADIAIAVSGPKGLMVPIVRNAEVMSLAEIEADIKRLAIKVREGKISMDEMLGGTFTITNGGVFGSMMSTPIINPPQSGILGMHNIIQRPIAVDGEVVIRPMMYIALSYDHRVIDGKDSVGFLVAIKKMLEDPANMIFGGKQGEEVLLGL
ncbi:MAG: 2-oxoglutarate dehydrogenase complex dihydrolipoyllysine-residue succinyltransferase [Flavobacteriales bacterium]|nr:2-oxoglutarate dehydrogenase complex dihydrolipoyllysine-residue succinyltransferase [Flavobacteriales bacterium]